MWIMSGNEEKLNDKNIVNYFRNLLTVELKILNSMFGLSSNFIDRAVFVEFSKYFL